VNISLILLCAGESSRLSLPIKKQWIRINNKPLWVFVLDRLINIYDFNQIVVVCHKNEINYMKNFVSDEVELVVGGDSRQESIKNALYKISDDYICIHDSARVCITQQVFDRLINAIDESVFCVAPYIKVSDTVFYDNKYLDRDNIKIIQTPQISKYEVLKQAIYTTNDFTDESSLIDSMDKKVIYTIGDKKLHKITFAKDIFDIKCLKKYLKKQKTNIRVGQGIDIHKFVDDKEMFLGGFKIPVDYGFLAHSDGDVLIHSIIDAILGAIGAGDIGEFFPDSDNKYQNMSSVIFLNQINTFLHNVGFEIVNIDISIIAQQPKINPYKQDIKTSLSDILNIPKYDINIKATTNEEMGYIGRKEGIAVHSIVNIKEIDLRQFL
jgi:2-C-methyl-D-erythritol 4-phosphate cytidylyltransferase/2-C-methyl-D-erythritol 2,4-cyclodiphosphate synthase